ncbi:IS200/IS605 family accessory protein TnpB-related protein [Kribbella caucasensis]|uniref:IS200/IS605 family accessory protein TnpB-related protein n=1 Tax=Kribbella caucasensis TaxID=2512215 RepID=UPI00192DA07B|nr:IS200/IS605 family accessory protein TnpB-related protein [Kribbella sp. VKM Ac-2527]
MCIRDRIKGLTAGDEVVLRTVGEHLGRLASADLACRVRDGLDHDSDRWADRKRDLTASSSSRWAGSITKATHDQWGLARRAQHAHAQSLTAGVRTIRDRLCLPVGEPGRSGQPGGYRSRQEWHAKSRRLTVLEARLAAVEADRAAGHVSVVRGGKRLLNKRHNLNAAGLTEAQWRHEWEATRWFLSADGESGKRCGNETIRVTLDGEVSLRLPAPLTHLANAPHGRYVLTGRVTFGHRGHEWGDRVEANRAVAYRIHHNPGKDRWYLDASWQRKDTTVILLETLRAGEVIGVDMNADHLAAWRLDTHGNPTGKPRTFAYDLTGTATRRDAQVRHALTRLLHWAKQSGVKAIAVEDLDFTDSKTREQHGRRKRFRQLVSGMPTSRLRTRLLAMTAEAGIAVIAVDPAYTSRWGAQHWQKPTSTPTHKTTRHEAAAIAIGRRALGHQIRRRTTPPRQHQTDAAGHRTLQAGSGTPGREEAGHPGPGPRTRSVPPTRSTYAGNQATQHRSGPPTDQDTVLLSV